MPFHNHSHHSGANSSTNPPGAASGIYQAAQALGSIGAPTGNLRVATSGQTAAGTDSLLPSSGNAPGFASAGQSGSVAMSNLSALGHPGPTSTAPPGTISNSHFNSQHDVSRRSQQSGRAVEELHIPGGSAQNIGQQNSSHSSQQQQQQQQHLYESPSDFTSRDTQSSAMNHLSPQSAQFSTSRQETSIPGPLQAGGAVRPGPTSSYTAPTTVPTIPQISTNAQQYSLPSRSNTLTSSHAHSRSSPAGLEQKYIPFSSTAPTPENPKYVPSQNQKFYGTANTPTGAVSQSPLALADIRPRASNMDDTGGALFDGNADRVASNSGYLAPWAVYAYDWCKWPVPGGNSAGRMAVGSYLEDPHNFIQILDTQMTPQEVASPNAPAYGLEYTKIAEATCSFPVTRILWEPPSSQKQSTDLLATSGDHLRLWSLPATASSNVSNTITRSGSVSTRDPPVQKLTPLALLSNSKTPEHTAPLTSLDWNTVSPKLIITSSIDTTCTIWDIPTLTAKTQLIAHDKEVFDVRFCAQSVDVFVSCGADGSVRMFDLRSLEHSTIIYEPSDKPGSPAGRMSPTKAQQTMSYAPPLLRLAASPHDFHLLATFAADSSLIRILDVRQPGQAMLELRGHSASVNSIEWAPTRRGMLASGADDSLVLIWDLVHSANGAALNGHGDASSTSAVSAASISGTPGGGAVSAAGAGAVHGGSSSISAKGPAASWRCDYEVGNLSWAPQSHLTSQGGEWVGVSGGRGIWGVKL